MSQLMAGILQGGQRKLLATLEANSQNINEIASLIATAGSDLVLKLGDNAGAQKLSITDTDDAEIFSIDSAGDIVTQGTTFIANATTFTIDDIIAQLGGDTAPVADDGKDRGISFYYYKASAKFGFMGWDSTDEAFMLLTDATESSGVMSGTLGALKAGAITQSGNAVLDVNTLAASIASELNNLTASEIQQLENIGAEAISAGEWAIVATLNQALNTSDSVSFSGLAINTADVTIDGVRQIFNNVYNNAVEDTARDSIANYPLQIEADYTADNWYPLLGLSNADDNATKVKIGIYAKEAAAGTTLHFGVTDTFASGLTTAMKFDYLGDLTVPRNIVVTGTVDGVDISDRDHAIYVHPTTNGNLHTPASGAANQFLQYASAGLAAWVTMGGEISLNGGTATIASSHSGSAHHAKFTAANAVDALEAVGAATLVAADSVLFIDATDGIMKKELLSDIDETMLTGVKSYIDGKDHHSVATRASLVLATSDDVEFTNLSLIGNAHNFLNPNANANVIVFGSDWNVDEAEFVDLTFRAQNSVSADIDYAHILAKIDNPIAGSDSGKLVFRILKATSTFVDALTLNPTLATFGMDIEMGAYGIRGDTFNITGTELGYLDAPTSHIQTQIDNIHSIFVPGVVTAHSDVTDAGSGIIISDDERTALHTEPPEITQANAEAGTATEFSQWSAERVKQAIDALAAGGDIDLLNLDGIIGSTYVDYVSATDSTRLEDTSTDTGADGVIDAGTGTEDMWFSIEPPDFLKRLVQEQGKTLTMTSVRFYYHTLYTNAYITAWWLYRTRWGNTAQTMKSSTTDIGNGSTGATSTVLSSSYGSNNWSGGAYSFVFRFSNVQSNAGGVRYKGFAITWAVSA